MSYLRKYSVPKKYQTFPIEQLKQIAKRILLALQFIHCKGLFHGHVHTGNILYDPVSQSVRLTDLANSLLGLAYFYRPYLVENKKIQNLEQVDVYGFGHVLYELAYGPGLFTSSGKLDFNDCLHRDLKQVLDLILVEDVLARNGPPTIVQLLELPFFKFTSVVDSMSLPASSSAAAAVLSSGKAFASAKAKETLIRVREFVEKRLNEEQKQLSKFKRLSQAESKAMSEEEVRKRRKEKKVRTFYYT